MNTNLVYDFEALKSGQDQRQIDKIKAIFSRYGCPIKSGSKESGVVVDSKTRRINGITTLQITLYLEDDQNVGLRIKQTGDIFEVSMNGTTIPITAQDDTNQVIKEICDRVIRGRANFIKKQSRKKTPDLMPKKSGDAPATLKQKVLFKQRILVDLNQIIDRRRQQLQNLKAVAINA
ncbi:MAG: hypothetical protein VXW65_14390 [Pseudomonadota bacterium]|nr:hypothetical protein [Pseudomonadota bacterium]